MRILYMVPLYWPSMGGAQLLSRELVRRIATRHSVCVVTQFTSDRDSFVQSVASASRGEYKDGEIPVHRIGPVGMWRPILACLGKKYGRLRAVNPLFARLLDMALAPQLRDIVSQFRPDIFHAVHIGLVYSSETAYRVARHCRVPYVWTPYPHIDGISGWQGRRFRTLYRASNAVVAMTNREKQWLVEQGALAQRVHVIPVGPLVSPEFDADSFRRSHNLGQSPMVLFLGQKLSYKGYRQMVEAAPLVWDQVPDARFVFIGPRTPDSERYFFGIDDPRILELPTVDVFEKNSALAACDIFCMPSVQESLGGVFLEAWSFRKPVIAANIDIAREVIEEGKDGLLVAQEPQSIATSVITLLLDARARSLMGQAGYQKVQEKYDWVNIVDRMERLYFDLTKFIGS